MVRASKMLAVFVTLAMMTAAAVMLLKAEVVFAAEPPKIVSLKGEGEKIPQSLTVKLGATIVWYNEGPGPVTIKFITRIGIACAAPMNFYSDLLGFYETTPVPQGGTASICLIEEGTYEYEVKRLMGKDKEQHVEVLSKGKIVSVK